MARIVCRARQLRLDYASKIGRPVEQKEVADAIEVTEATLSRVERGKLSRIDFETLIKLCSFYRTAIRISLYRQAAFIAVNGIVPTAFCKGIAR